MTSLNVGAHLSLGRSPRDSLAEAQANGATSMQIFASSPAAWRPPVLQELKCAELTEALRELGMGPLFLHSIYLINLASPDPTILKRSGSSLIATLDAGAELGAQALITHIGSHAGRGFSEVADQVARELRAILDAAPHGTDLALENSAGAGGIIGGTIEELAELIERAGGSQRLKIVLDTAHLCAMGWDFRLAGETQRLVETVRESTGLDRLVALHVNDSKAACGSRRDRHSPIGEGSIGEDGFASLLTRPELRSVPWILETPDLDSRLAPELRFRSIATLRRLDEASRHAPVPAGV